MGGEPSIYTIQVASVCRAVQGSGSSSLTAFTYLVSSSRPRWRAWLVGVGAWGVEVEEQASCCSHMGVGVLGAGLEMDAVWRIKRRMGQKARLVLQPLRLRGEACGVRLNAPRSNAKGGQVQRPRPPNHRHRAVRDDLLPLSPFTLPCPPFQAPVRLHHPHQTLLVFFLVVLLFVPVLIPFPVPPSAQTQATTRKVSIHFSLPILHLSHHPFSTPSRPSQPRQTCRR